MTDKFGMAIFTAFAFLTIVGLAFWGWKSRVRRQEALVSAPLEALDYFGDLLGSATGFYVATTFTDNSLERFAGYGLGTRGLAQILVFSEGVLIVRTGERPLAISHNSLIGVAQGQVAIDKAVEPGGLVQIDWIQDGVPLTTHLRIKNFEERDLVVGKLSEICQVGEKSE